MKRYEYRVKGVLICIVDVGLNEFSILRMPDGSFHRMPEHDTHALAKALVLNAKVVTKESQS